MLDTPIRLGELEDLIAELKRDLGEETTRAMPLHAIDLVDGEPVPWEIQAIVQNSPFPGYKNQLLFLTDSSQLKPHMRVLRTTFTTASIPPLAVEE